MKNFKKKMERNPNRIPVIMNAFKKTYNLIRFHDFYVNNSNDVNEFIASVKDLNYLEIESFWMRNPDLRFTQMLYNINNKSIIGYFEPLYNLEDSEIIKTLHLE